MSNPWFRLYSEFSTDPKVQMMSEAMQRRYVMLMCMRCSNVTVTLLDEEIAFQLRISDEELAETKALFVKKGFIDDAWNLLNWEKRQFKSDHDLSGAQRQKRFRDKAKQGSNDHSNVTVTLPDTDTDTDTDKKKTERTTARGSRLPENFEPDFQFAVDAGIQNTLEEAHKFRDYWNAQPGQKGVKLDWPATWRNWCRNAKPARQPGKQAESFAERDERKARERYEEATGKRSRTVIDITPSTQVLERLQ